MILEDKEALRGSRQFFLSFLSTFLIFREKGREREREEEKHPCARETLAGPTH